MNGGVIDSCVANGRTGGGGVRNDGLFIMGKDATIKNCKAVENGQRNIGSGIVLAGDERQTIGGTIISEDVVDEKYIFINRSTMAIGESANIHANITLDGGKIDLMAAARPSMARSPTIATAVSVALPTVLSP